MTRQSQGSLLRALGTPHIGCLWRSLELTQSQSCSVRQQESHSVLTACLGRPLLSLHGRGLRHLSPQYPARTSSQEVLSECFWNQWLHER